MFDMKVLIKMELGHSLLIILYEKIEIIITILLITTTPSRLPEHVRLVSELLNIVFKCMFERHDSGFLFKMKNDRIPSPQN